VKAAVLVAPRRIEVREVAAPEPGPGQVLVRIEGCGVCGSNLEIWEGRPWFTYPLAPGAPGHEGWGIVEARGPGAEAVAIGARVGFLSARAFAECDVASVDEVVTLPGELAGMPFPGEPLACAVNVVEAAGIAARDRVAVVGCGFLGLNVVALAAARGAEVTALNRRPEGLAAAREAGAVRAVSLDQAGGLPAYFDVAVEAAGRQDTLEAAGRLPREEGTLVIAGFHQDGRRTVDLGSWNWRALHLVNGHRRDPRAYVAGMREAIRLVTQGVLDPTPLYTHRFRLAHAAAAFEALAERPRGFVKGLVLA
jgi:threonine dehydrogenase-like Zn-dependent dehydrogenase